MANKQAILAKIKRTLSNARKAWWVLLIMLAFMIAGALFLDTSCLLASTTGLPCPGCGGTRAALSLIDGDMKSSLYYHPFLIPSVIFAIIYFSLSLFTVKKPRHLDKFLIIYTIILIAFYAIRMIMYFPHTEPMAYNYSAVLPRMVRLVTYLFS